MASEDIEIIIEADASEARKAFESIGQQRLALWSSKKAKDPVDQGKSSKDK